jgi:hypothetical protein
MLKTKAVVCALQLGAEMESDLASAAAHKVANDAFLSWLHEGPGKGIGRQHRISRTAVGWKSSREAVPTDEGTYEEVDGISGHELREACLGSSTAVPRNAQQAAEQEGIDWGREWQTPGKRVWR